MIEVVQHRLRPFGQLDLQHVYPGSLHVVLAQGHGSRLLVPAHWLSLCWPLRGSVWLQSDHLEWRLPAGRLQVWSDGALRCRSTEPTGWMVVSAPAHVWRQLSHRHGDEPLLAPWQARMSRDLAHELIAATRAPADEAAGTAVALIDSMARRQADLRGLLERCAGRTRQLRQQTMTRLLRVRHAIFCDPGQRQDLDRLAHLANYSPCHLLRMHRRVFGETPFEYACRLRDLHALELVSGTRMSILDISLRLGFESQSAFCRVFKINFGATPTDIRRHALEQARQAA